MRSALYTLTSIAGLTARMIVVGLGLAVIAHVLSGETSGWRFWGVVVLAGSTYALAALAECFGNHMAGAKDSKERA